MRRKRNRGRGVAPFRLEKKVHRQPAGAALQPLQLIAGLKIVFAVRYDQYIGVGAADRSLERMLQQAPAVG